MRRREFLKASAAIGAATAATVAPTAVVAGPEAAKKHSFKLKYAPHFNMFKHSAGDDLIDQLKFASDQGFTAWEDNGMKSRPVELQEKIARTMAQKGLQMGVFVAHGSIGKLTFARKDKEDNGWATAPTTNSFNPLFPSHCWRKDPRTPGHCPSPGRRHGAHRSVQRCAD